MVANEIRPEPAYAGDKHVKYASAPGKVDAEAQLLAEMKLPYSAELLINASFAAESSERTQEAADQLEIGTGAFIAGRDVLGSPAEVAELIEELKRPLAAKGKSQGVDEDLVDLWIHTEPWLDEREIADLWPAFVAKLPGEPERINRSRGSDAQGGGANAQREGS